MLRRLLPTLLALGCGLLALGWGLVTLQRIFTQEREDARAQVHSRSAALELLAAEALRTALAQRMKDHLPALNAAMGDPLQPAEGYYLLFRGHQFLPRVDWLRDGTDTPAKAAYERLVQALEDGDAPAPWQERLARLRAVDAAMATGSNARISAAVEALLRHHAVHPLPTDQELPFTLIAVEHLQRGDETPPLIRALVGEGLPEELGGMARGAGLQRDLLRARPRLTRDDFDFLQERIVALSLELGEPSDAFQARVREAGAGALVLPDSLKGPSIFGEQWYVEPGAEQVRGLAVDLTVLLADLTRDLRARGLLLKDSEVRLRPAGVVRPLSDPGLEVAMPGWAKAEADIEARYGLKTLLVAVCGALASAIAALAVVAQQRKYRFVELKSDFVSTVSHELRTPLASIRLLGETLERRLGRSPEAGDYPTRIVRAAEGLHFLVENILSFNRIDKGRWALRPSRVRLEEAVGTLRDDLLDAVQVPVELRSEVDDVELDADASLVRMLFANLGRNACLYNQRSPVVLTVRAYPQPGFGATVLFSDNGMGIPPEEWERVFDDFYRLTTTGPEVHGSGLGLALCRRIMGLHQGSIQIASSSEEGTTFALTFPETRR
ncbi:sensor histidine kinase [Corallococcus praedator]|uniref:histidine kinase n=1 Tax=Corallococcus praedator TaxID=2316724 RepID=A0ABX9QIT0_9BACT|nr:MULTISPECIES: HAMP domain-containing sensor histidine kinase [Corallococcus]RKH21410.1 sensor histidine kinase [Corallococcus sp. CA047B]RKH35063.1 sensor histidine kinase [Corallococcus sp. CA031C]RKI07347.1 sensor histidine kinase [Corallococcus praedator]